MHTDLKDQRELSKTLERDLINIKDNLKKEETINARLENQVKSFLEKKKFEENILILKKKRSWVVNICFFFGLLFSCFLYYIISNYIFSIIVKKRKVLR